MGINDLYIVFINIKNNMFLLKIILNVDLDVIDYIVERYLLFLDFNYCSGSNCVLIIGKIKSIN